MSIIWFNDEAKDVIVTLTPTQITINKFGAQFFETYKQVMLGYDKEDKIIVIRPLSKEQTLRGDIPEHSRYNISNNVSYARITNKSFMSTINDEFSLNLPKEGIKFKANWRVNQDVLEISLKEVL